MTEYLAENARLRQLSRRHAEGQMAFADYRAARRALLEALEAGQVQPEATALPEDTSRNLGAVPAVLADPEAVLLKTMPPQLSPEEPAAPPPAAVAVVGWDGPTRILAAVLGLAMLLALGALFYVFAL